ncbi:MAG TPA: hypothetical protein VM266_10740 [Solirubrobacteraceae bacterium]|nr:hypothetical protein [Solirubrobacteraceae bacterium]
MLAALVSTAVLALGAQAPPQEQTATAGQVTARITWKGEFPSARDLRITIDRAGGRLVDEEPDTRACGRCLSPHEDALRVLDLDGDAEPEVLLDGTTGGAHCCNVTLVYRFDGTGYRRIERFWGNQGYVLEDLDGDARPELNGRDDLFSYVYGAYAESMPPALVLALRHGRLRDVTRSYPDLLRADARYALARYRRLARSRHGNVRPALALYDAAQHRLGRPARSHRLLRSALRRGLLARRSRFDFKPFGRAYIRDLHRRLRRGGHITP